MRWERRGLARKAQAKRLYFPYCPSLQRSATALAAPANRKFFLRDALIRRKEDATFDRARQQVERRVMLTSAKTAAGKKRKQTITQILREAYARHCHDRATLSALRQLLKSDSPRRMDTD